MDVSRVAVSSTGVRDTRTEPPTATRPRAREGRTRGRGQRRYAIRAGIEASLSQNVRAHGLRRSRYRDVARTHVRHVFTAMPCNAARVADWIDTVPRTPRRATHFRTLCSAAK
ncbi:transposase [Streptomyces marokkonensis]|uniref:Transposase n=1 Tax=Streptomyces marokkonensis TaxID=324855 RepID=A0ABW6Q0N2_9ACTN